MYLLFAFILLISIFFLRDSYWQTTLSEREFVALYVEVVRLESRLSDKPKEARAQTREFLNRAGVTEKEMNRFIGQVNKKPERWAKIWEKINKELEQDSTLLKSR